MLEIVVFLKFVGEIQQLLRKRQQKNHQDKFCITFHFLSTIFYYYSYHLLTIVLLKALSHSKTIKNAKKLSVFDENGFRCLSNFLQTHIFWGFNHICRTYNFINYRNIWFAKALIILIMTTQVLFFDFVSLKGPAR